MGFDGIGIPSRNIVGLGSNAPEDKASKIKNWIVKEHPGTLHYFDDSMKNLREFEVQFDELVAYIDSRKSGVLTKAAVDGVRGWFTCLTRKEHRGKSRRCRFTLGSWD